MIYEEYKPHPALRAYIECYWSAVAERPPFQEREALIPDGTIELMFNFGEDYHQHEEEGTRRIAGSHIIGIRGRSLFISQSRRQDFFAVRFKTGGAYPFLAIPSREYTGKIMGMREMLGAEFSELEERLYETSCKRMRVAIVDHFLLGRLPEERPASRTAQYFIAAAVRGTSNTIGEISAEMGLNYKQLERHFAESTGLSPRHYLKIRRFSYALKLMYSGRCRSLTEVSCEAGYHDQAHFIRDFKALTLQSPRAFLQSRFKIVEVIQPALARRLSKTYNL